MQKILSNILLVILGGLVAVMLYKFLENPSTTTNNQQDLRIVPSVYNTNADAQTQMPSANLPSGNKTIALPMVDFTTTAERTTPTVVHIKTKISARRGNWPSELDFFFNPGSRSGKKDLSTGSGVIISSDGYIVTNKHVIENADEILVALNDKRQYNAVLIGEDPSTDLAVIKIEGRNFPFITYADSDMVRVGEWVMAVGNPFNLASTVTTGIVSAKARNINILQDQLAIESFIQTDAAVNPGNSGGALVNLRGELIGINTAIATPTGSYAGYAFAVPANIVKKVVIDIQEFGTVQRGFLGVQIRGVDAQMAQKLGLRDIKGVYVAKVSAGGAAANAGIQAGDIIVKVQGRVVNSSPELQEVIGRYRPNDRVVMLVQRNGRRQEVEITLRGAY